MHAAGIVTLITDFGLDDPYVGQLKGALVSGFDNVRIIDITHSVPRHDICSAAFTLWTSYRFFPTGTVHLVVVDPGVGTDRRILAAHGNGHFFIAPDNGILSLVQKAGELETLREISLSEEPASTTFHGRDIMAPAAAVLAGGGIFQQTGPEISAGDCVFHEFGKAKPVADGLEGEVLRIDHYGNIRTSITEKDLQALPVQPPLITIRAGSHELRTIVRSYADIPIGGLGALIDSDGFLEIAVNQGSAAEKTMLRRGSPVQVKMDRIEQQ